MCNGGTVIVIVKKINCIIIHKQKQLFPLALAWPTKCPTNITAKNQGPNRSRNHLLLFRSKLSLFQRIPRDVWLPVLSILESSWCVRWLNLSAESWLGEGASWNVMAKAIARSRSGQSIAPFKKTCTGRQSWLCRAVRRRAVRCCAASLSTIGATTQPAIESDPPISMSKLLLPREGPRSQAEERRSEDGSPERLSVAVFVTTNLRSYQNRKLQKMCFHATTNHVIIAVDDLPILRFF